MMRWIGAILFLFHFETALAEANLCSAVIGNSESSEVRLGLIRQFLNSGRAGGHQGAIELKALINHYQAALNFEPITTKDFQFAKQAREIESLITQNQSDLLELAKLIAAEKEGSSFGNSFLRRKKRIQELELKTASDKLIIDRAIKAFFDRKSDYFKYEKRLQEFIGELQKLKEILENYPTRSTEESAVVKQEILLLDQALAANKALVGSQTSIISQSEAEIQSALKIYRADRQTLLTAGAVKKDALDPLSNPTFVNQYLRNKLSEFYLNEREEYLNEAVEVLKESLPKTLRIRDYEWVFTRINPKYLDQAARHHRSRERKVDHILAMFHVYKSVSGPMREKAFEIIKKLEVDPKILTISPLEMYWGYEPDPQVEKTFYTWLIEISKSDPVLFQDLPMFVDLYNIKEVEDNYLYEQFYKFPKATSKALLDFEFKLSKVNDSYIYHRRIYIYLLTKTHALLKELVPRERWPEFLNAERIVPLYKVVGMYQKQGHPLTPTRLHALMDAVGQMGLSYRETTASSHFMNEIQQPKWSSLWEAPDEEFVYRLQLITKIFMIEARAAGFRNMEDYSGYHESVKEEAYRKANLAFKKMHQLDELARVLLPDIQDPKKRAEYQEHLFQQMMDQEKSSSVDDYFKFMQSEVLKTYILANIKGREADENLSAYITFTEEFVEKANQSTNLQFKRNLLRSITVFEKAASRSQFLIEVDRILRSRGVSSPISRFILENVVISFGQDAEKLKSMDPGQVVRYFMRFEKDLVTTYEYRELVLKRK